jgi:hypothetical protein
MSAINYVDVDLRKTAMVLGQGGAQVARRE